MNYDKKMIIHFAEFIVVFIIFILPPMLCTEAPALPAKPESLPQYFFLIVKVILFAAYEEALYRLYLPFRLKTLLKKSAIASYFFITEFMPAVFFACAHLYLGTANAVYAFAAGGFFRVVYVFFKTKYGIWSAFCLIVFIHTVHNLISIFIRYQP